MKTCVLVLCVIVLALCWEAFADRDDPAMRPPTTHFTTGIFFHQCVGDMPYYRNLACPTEAGK